MAPWARMHKGMGLKSPDFGTNVYTPSKGFRFVEWCRARNISTVEPISIDLFVEYGRWAQQKLVPQLEQVDVTSMRKDPEGFRLRLGSGADLVARRVVVATGLSHYARMPRELDGVPAGLASHTTRHREYLEFAGCRVAVIGGGASALEAGVMLQEAGADVRVLMRGTYAYLGGPRPARRTLRERLSNPNSVLGPGRKSFLLQRVPWGMHYLSAERRLRFTKTYLGPAAGWWLGERARDLPLQRQTRVVSASESNGRVHLKLRIADRDETWEVDHVVCGTGFEVDVDRLPFVDPSLAGGVRRIERAPQLSRHFESSVPGLYFVGPAAAFSFGPLLRFVAGAEFAAPTVARHLARHRRAERTRAVRETLTEPA